MDNEDEKLLAEIGRSSEAMKEARWSMFGYGTAGSFPTRRSIGCGGGI